MTRRATACRCLRCNPPPPNKDWRYSPPVASRDGKVVWVDANAVAAFLPVAPCTGKAR